MPEFINFSSEIDKQATSETEKEPTVQIRNWENAIEINYVFPGFWLGDKEPANATIREGHREVGISGAGFLSESGKPLMPSFGRFVQIPQGFDYEVTVDTGPKTVIEDVLVTPAQENAFDAETSGQAFEFDAEFYEQDALYPEMIAEISGPQQLDGYRVLLIHVRPLQYAPKKHQLIGFEKVKVTIRLIPSKDTPLDESFPNTPPSNKEGFGNLLLNPKRLTFPNTPTRIPPGPLKIRLIGPELIIIYDSSLKLAADRLARWKQEKGIDTSTVCIDDIGNSPEKIKEYIRKSHKQYWNLNYVLFLGDVSAIATEYLSFPLPFKEAATDHYYFTERDRKDNEDCVLPWLSGGRIPVSSLSEAITIVDQIIAYESRPPCDPEYYRRMLFAAYFQDDYEDGRADRAYMKTMEGIREHMVSIGFDVERTYVSNSDKHLKYRDGTEVPTAVQNAIVDQETATQMLISGTSEGQLIVAHRDHGDWDGWVAPPFKSTHVETIISEYPSVFYSVNCLTGRFDMPSEDCFAESILRNEGAAPSLIAATRISGTWRNDSLMKGLFDGMWPGVIPTFPSSTASYAIRHNRIGDILNYAKSYLLVAHGSNSGVQHHLSIYHVIGDPTLQVWAEEPQTFKLSANLSQKALNIRLTPAPKDCVVTIWQGEKMVKRIKPASSQISLPLTGLRIETAGSFRRLAAPLEICAFASGHRFTRQKIRTTALIS